MAFSLVGTTNAAGTGVATLDLARPAGILTNDLIIAAYSFENVAANSAPYIIPNTGQYGSSVIGPNTGYLQYCQEAPSATGVGFEVWAAVTGSTTDPYTANFNASYNVVAVSTVWRGALVSNNHGLQPVVVYTVRASTVAQVSGNAPAAPSVYA